MINAFPELLRLLRLRRYQLQLTAAKKAAKLVAKERHKNPMTTTAVDDGGGGNAAAIAGTGTHRQSDDDVEARLAGVEALLDQSARTLKTLHGTPRCFFCFSCSTQRESVTR